MAFKSGVVLGTVNLNATGTAGTSIGATSNSGTIAIGNASSTAVNMLGPVNINTTGSSGTAIASTSNNGTVSIGSTSSTAVNIVGPVNINTTSTGNTAIASTSNSGTVSIGNTSSGAITIGCGTAGISVGATANAHTTTIGSTTASSTTVIQAPSAGVILTGVQGVAVANKNYVTINTATGAIGSDAGPASSISITGDTGGALTGSSFTFTGGTTGLSFGGSGSTETLTFAGITANGGTVSLATDATGSTVNIGTGAGAKVVTLGSTNGASSLALQTGTADFTLASATGTIMSALDTGEITYPLQSAFLACLATKDNDVTGDGTAFTLGTGNALTEIFDQNSDFNTNGTFTAPVTGRYFLGANCLTQQATAGMLGGCLITTSNRNYIFSNYASIAAGNFPLAVSALTDMDAADTAIYIITLSGGAKVVDIYGNAAPDNRTWFCGNLVC